MVEIGSGVVLVGMPGSGKSTVGRLVAERLGRPFIDTDALFEHRHGAPVPEYLRERGEPSFRAAEAVVVAEACAAPGAVVSAGGGAVVDPINRWRLWHHGTVAWLDVAPQLVVERLEADAVARPAFQPYRVPGMAAVLARRAAFYLAADIRVDADASPATVAGRVLEPGGRRDGRRLFDAEIDRHHPIGPATARVLMGVDLDLASFVPRGICVADRRIAASVPARACLRLRAGERAKRLRSLERVLDWLVEQRVERGEALIAEGGGTIGDLAGTAAALYARGIDLVHVPTTWLAQADSALGGKVAVDLDGAKNAAGAFWPPVAVISDVARLRTLPRSLRRDGAAESVKAALIGDPDLWRLLETRGPQALGDDEEARYAIIERSARVKLDVCERDPFETGERRVLNLGHTVGHALEVESAFRLAHGTAVALGLRAVARIAAGRGGDAELPSRLDALLASLGFELRRPFDAERVGSALGTDKKRIGGRQRWLLPMAIGEVEEVDDVTDAEVGDALRAIAA